MGANTIIEMKGLTKTFPGVVAVNNVNLEIRRNTVTAIVGENGAGKSTLVKIIAGVYNDYVGTVMFEGKEVKFKHPREAIEAGITLVPQELDLIPNLSVAENIWLGHEYLNFWGLIDYRKMCEESARILRELSVSIDPTIKVDRLSTGYQQIVAIAKALASRSKLIIMDEPTSAISENEVAHLFSTIRKLKEQGKTLIYISHKLDEIFAVADEVIVMRDGIIVGTGSVKDFNYDALVRLMVGRSIDKFYVKEKAATSIVAFEVKDLSVRNERGKFVVKDVSFAVRAGEVLGVYGLIGAGRTEAMEAIFGLYPEKYVSGRVLVNGKDVKISRPLDAIRAGIGYVPEDRKLSGLILQMSVSQNISLASLKSLSRLGFVKGAEERRLAQEYVNRLNIKTPSLRQIVQNLSGGNQQKVVLAKWLALKPKVLILDEPTRGIDVNAKAEIYSLINHLAKSGVAIVLVSSELPEILAMSDRIMVMSEGRKTAEFTKEQATEEKLLKAAIPRSFEPLSVVKE